MTERLFRFAQIIDNRETNLPEVTAGDTTFTTILNIIFTIVGAVAFLFVVIAGIRYITSQGDPAKLTSAKNQVLYSLIGLIIAVLAGVIVNYVLGRA